MKVFVAGAGLMGKAIVSDLARDSKITEIKVVDINETKLTECATINNKVKTQSVDVTDEVRLADSMRGYDVAAGSLLHAHSPGLVRAAILTGVSLVDLVGSKPELRMAMHDDALKAGVTIIPGFGVAPGITNMLAAVGAERLSQRETIKILVGGIPRFPSPPLNYRVVYALDSVLNTILRKARVVIDGQLAKKEPLTEVEEIHIGKGIGICEAYLTDGLSTLTYTIPKKYPEIKEAMYKTIRYPGFVEKMKFLVDCGLFSTEEVSAGGVMVSPRKVLEAALQPILSTGDERDATVVRVEVVGTSKIGEKRIRWTFELLDLFDEETKTTSMARTTGYTCAIACRLVMQGKISSRGVVPVEEIFTGELYELMKSELATRGINITEKLEELG